MLCSFLILPETTSPVCHNGTLSHNSFLFHMCFPLSPTMNDICSKSLRSLRCRLEMGKTSTNSNSTTGLIKKHHHSFRPQSDKLRERRATQQSRDCNLAIILISTVVMFFLCHLPRVVTRFTIAILCSRVKNINNCSIYEAANIHSILDCRERGESWFLLLLISLHASWHRDIVTPLLQEETKLRSGSCTSPTPCSFLWWQFTNSNFQNQIRF